MLELVVGDPEYAIPGALDRRVEAWPERTNRRIDALEARILRLEQELKELKERKGALQPCNCR